MATVSGFRTTTPATSIAMPRGCSRCGEPGTKERSTQASVGGKKTRSTTIPYCDACFARASAIDSKRTRIGLTVFALSLAVSAFGVLVPFLPKAVLIFVPVALAVFIGIVLRSRAGTSIEQPHGAWMTGGNASSTVFFCTNQKWAEQFAAANGTTAVPATTGDGGNFWIIGLLVSAAASAYVAFACQPAVRVDNATGKPVQVWIDGKPRIVVDPTREIGQTRPEIALAFGTHKFGWSPVGATKPTEESAPYKIEWSGNHLYSPGKATCYTLDVSTYGTGSSKGMPEGPQPLADVYTFKHVDNWFKHNEHSVSTKSSGAVRTALLPMNDCAKLTEMGAPVEVRAEFASCMKAAYTQPGDAAEKACAHDAVRALSRSGVKPGSTSPSNDE